MGWWRTSDQRIRPKGRSCLKKNKRAVDIHATQHLTDKNKCLFTMFELHQNVLINLHDGTGHVLHELIPKYFKFNKMENDFFRYF